MERSNLYGFLAAVYRKEPTPELLTLIGEPGFQDALARTGVSLGADIPTRPAAQLVEDLAVEYTRLFIGPGPHVPPYAAIHLGGEGASLWGPSTQWVKRFIESVGFEYEADYRDLPDHIGVELEFMREITAREARALSKGDLEQTGALRDIEREFMGKHLALWTPAFCDKVMAMAELPFFAGAAKLTKDFIRSEYEELARAAA